MLYMPLCPKRLKIDMESFCFNIIGMFKVCFPVFQFQYSHKSGGGECVQSLAGFTVSTLSAFDIGGKSEDHNQYVQKFQVHT